MGVTKDVEFHFSKRLQAVLDLINQYGIKFDEIGVFGSYSRGSYKSTSDLDICIITDHKPDRRTSGSLREEAEDLHADIIYVTREYIANSSEPFAVQLRADYRRIS